MTLRSNLFFAAALAMLIVSCGDSSTSGNDPDDPSSSSVLIPDSSDDGSSEGGSSVAPEGSSEGGSSVAPGGSSEGESSSNDNSSSSSSEVSSSSSEESNSSEEESSSSSEESSSSEAGPHCGTVPYDTTTHLCDIRDAKLYRFVTLGTQTWMAENLDFGTMVSVAVNQVDATADAAQKYCYNDTAAYCDSLGGLYQWHTAMAVPQLYDTTCTGIYSLPIGDEHRGICPAGWHVPSPDEFDTLRVWADSANGGESNDEAQSLKSVEGWIDGYGWAGPSDDAFGFTAFSTGYVYNGAFYSIGEMTGWWTTEFSGVIADARRYKMNRGEKTLSVGGFMRHNAFPVRCLKN